MKKKSILILLIILVLIILFGIFKSMSHSPKAQAAPQTQNECVDDTQDDTEDQ